VRTSSSRRLFLKSAIAAPAAGTVFSRFLSAVEAKGLEKSDSGLNPIRDETTGLPLLKLPEGFRYQSFGWVGDVMSDGVITPEGHDGMGVISQTGDIVTLCRNHEIKGAKSFGPAELTFDSKAGGGCANLQFNVKSGKWLRSWTSLAGTVQNCAGGPTPWGTWLSCEETVIGPKESFRDVQYEHEKHHGWVFEVPAEGKATVEPLQALGRFVHEALAIDPAEGTIYETEDRDTAGFYRFLPNEPEVLTKGGRLQMIKIKGKDDLRTGARTGIRYEAEWVDIEDPLRRNTPGKEDGLGVYSQGKDKGATTFGRLEGCWFGDGVVYFNCTNGGEAGLGQVWSYSPKAQTLELVFQSPRHEILDSPDNLTVSPRGGLILCEDADLKPLRLHALSRKGELKTVAVNNIQLKSGQHGSLAGDFSGGEWAGACFSPDGEWLFVNIHDPGVTFAITGPWEELGV
jgi:secreted PhoX family phosphatase|tara:strand:- start:22986 stop:24356 length:1371 start_codon:yes stop_codon:yes gene_type:complete